MAASTIPHFHNTPGVRVIHVGAKEFMCIGALPPFDHPHIYIDMGSDTEVVCGYCSTLYRFDPALAEGTSLPAECLWHEEIRQEELRQEELRQADVKPDAKPAEPVPAA